VVWLFVKNDVLMYNIMCTKYSATRAEHDILIFYLSDEPCTRYSRSRYTYEYVPNVRASQNDQTIFK
jgi:hypothetical protein